MTDKQRLDKLQELAKGYGFGWICRRSSTGRGIRLHETSLPEATPNIRDAIDNFIAEEGCSEGKTEDGKGKPDDGSFMHIDIPPNEDCKNEDVFIMCLKCNKCGRFDKKEDEL